MRKLKLNELGRKTIEEFKNSSKIPITVVLDNIRSGQNVGSLFRTSDAFLVERIVLCGISPKPPHRHINKTAIGATKTIDWTYSKDVVQAVQHIKNENKKIVLIEQTDSSIPLSDFKVESNESYALVFGNEVNGISEGLLKLADYAVEIEQFGTKHSLNVAVCAGIVLWRFWEEIIAKADQSQL